MALAITVLTSGGTVASTAFDTASITVPNNAVCYAWVSPYGAVSSPGIDTTLGGAGLSWSRIADVDRTLGSSKSRRLTLYRAINTSGSDATGVLSLTASVTGGSVGGVDYSIEKVTGADTTTPNETPLTANWGVANYTFASVGTPAAGDRVYGGQAGATSTTSAEAYDGFTILSDINSVDGRNFVSSYDASDPQDDTPSNQSNSGGGIVLLLKLALPASFIPWDYAPDAQQIFHNPR